MKLDLENLKVEIEELKSSKEKMKGFSKLVQQFEQTKSELLEQFKKINNVTDSDCPFCGSPFTTYEELIRSIEDQKSKFIKLLSDEDIEYKQKFDRFIDKYIVNINREIETYLSIESNIIPEDFLNELSKAYKNRTEITEFIEWSTKQNIGLEIFYNQTDVYETLSESRKNELLSYLESKLKNISTDYKNHETNKFTFKNIFDSKDSNVRSIDIQDIINKSNYINSQFYNNSSNKISEYN